MDCGQLSGGFSFHNSNLNIFNPFNISMMDLGSIYLTEPWGAAFLFIYFIYKLVNDIIQFLICN